MFVFGCLWLFVADLVVLVLSVFLFWGFFCGGGGGGETFVVVYNNGNAYIDK